MNDAAARALAERALAPGETLLWAEAAPLLPALPIYLSLAIGSACAMLASTWLIYRFWRHLLRALPDFTKLHHKALSLGGLTLASLAVAAFALVLGVYTISNAVKTISVGSTAYAISDRQAMIVHGVVAAPFTHTLNLAELRIVREGDDLLLGQFMGLELFGRILDPAFFDLEDVGAVEAMLRRVSGDVSPAAVLSNDVRARIVAPDAETLAAITPALYVNETVVWAQHADGRPYLFHSSVVLAFTGFFGLGLFLGSIWRRKDEADDPAEMRLAFGVIGALLLLWAIASAGWILGGRRVYYALTDRRVIVLHAEPWRATHIYSDVYFEDPDDVRVADDTIRFCGSSSGSRRRRGCGDKYLSGVRDAENVARLIRDTFTRRPADAEAGAR